MNAIGFDIPGNGVVVRPSAIIVGLLVGTIVTIVCRRSSRPARPRASRRSPRCATSRSSGRSTVLRRIVIGGAIAALGIVAAVPRAVRRQRHRVVRRRRRAAHASSACSCSARCSPRPVALVIGAPLTKLKGITGSLARENAARNPRRTATTGGRADDRRLARRLHHDLRGVGQGVDRRRDRPAAQDRLHRHSSSGGGGPGRRSQPRRSRSRSRRCPRSRPSTPVRLGDAGDQRQPHVRRRPSIPRPRRQLFDFGSVAGSFADLDDRTAIAVSKRKANDNHWKLGDTIPVTFVKTGDAAAARSRTSTRTTRSATTSSRSRRYEKNFTDQLDFLIFAKLKPGVSARRRAATAIEPLLDAVPDREAAGQRAVQGRPEDADQPGRWSLVYVLLFLAVIIALIGIANTLDALDPRANARDRAAARGRR